MSGSTDGEFAARSAHFVRRSAVDSMIKSAQFVSGFLLLAL